MDLQGRHTHTVPVVYSVILRTLCLHYQSLPDVRDMKISELEFWYDGLRPRLKALTKPQKDR